MSCQAPVDESKSFSVDLAKIIVDDKDSDLEITNSVVPIESRLQSIENVLKELKSVVEFIEKERTSPRGRIDAMLTNTQHILNNMTEIKKQVNNLNEQLSELETQVSELQATVHFDIIHLTDECTKLRIEVMK